MAIPAVTLPCSNSRMIKVEATRIFDFSCPQKGFCNFHTIVIVFNEDFYNFNDEFSQTP